MRHKMVNQMSIGEDDDCAGCVRDQSHIWQQRPLASRYQASWHRAVAKVRPCKRRRQSPGSCSRRSQACLGGRLVSYPRSATQKVASILLALAAALGTDLLVIASLSQTFPEIIELSAYFSQLIERWF